MLPRCGGVVVIRDVLVAVVLWRLLFRVKVCEYLSEIAAELIQRICAYLWEQGCRAQRAVQPVSLFCVP